jgi:hypothetical protein
MTFIMTIMLAETKMALAVSINRILSAYSWI